MSYVNNFKKYLDKTVTFKNIVSKPDGFGGIVEDVTSFTKNCYIEQASSSEIVAQSQIGNTITHLLICEYDSRINKNTKATYNNKDFSLNPPDNACTQNEHMEIYINYV